MGEVNGIELAQRIRLEDSRVQIVFITGFPDFMAEGYEVSALHYLMKPVSREKLCAVLDRAAANLARPDKRLQVNFDRETCFVPFQRILYIEAQKQYVRIRTEDGDYRMKASLAEMEAMLDKYFFKCQRSCSPDQEPVRGAEKRRRNPHQQRDGGKNRKGYHTIILIMAREERKGMLQPG